MSVYVEVRDGGLAVRLGKLCGNGPGIWTRMQAAYDTWHAEREVDTDLIPTLHPANTS